MSEGATPERLDPLVEPGTDPAHLGLGDPRVDPHGRHQVVDRPGRDAVPIGPHDDRVEGLADAAAGRQKRREERAGAQLRNPHRQVAGLGRQRLSTRSVAMGHTGVASLVAAGADLLGGLSLDELLQGPLGELTDEIGAVSGAERVEQLRQGRIGQSHRCGLLVVHLAYTPSITPVAHLMVDRPRNPTTWGDSYARLEQGRKEAAAAELRDPEGDVPYLVERMRVRWPLRSFERCSLRS